MLPENAASGGLYGYFEVSESKGIDKQVIAVDNTVNGQEIATRINNDIRVTGMKMTAQDVDIVACNFSWQTSSDNGDGISLPEFNIGAEVGSRNAAWSNKLAQIVGSQL